MVPGGRETRVRVLVAEDEPVMADTIAEGLRRRAMAVDVCYDGDAALERVMVHRYDVVILDRDLPLVHGDEVCRRIVAVGGETRVLMLTAAAGIRDRVDGLDLGADDYLTNPFAFAELVARVGSLGRRAGRRCRRCSSGPGSGWIARSTAPGERGCCCPCRRRSSRSSRC